MNIIVTGSLGHISKPLAQTLVQQGHSITVISSDPSKKSVIERLGGKPAIGSIEDVEFLTDVFNGADAIYSMIPPRTYATPGFDVYGYCQQIADNYAQAILNAGVTRLVHLSSIGADVEKGSGLLRLHYNAEHTLGNLSGVDITFMRPVGFYYNLLAFIPMIRSTGFIATNYGAEDSGPWVSPLDIADAIADEIQTPLSGRKVRYVASEELTCNQVASILGEAIGKPDLKWIRIPDEQMEQGLIAGGFSPAIAQGMVEMYAGLRSGLLRAEYYKNRPTLGKVKLKDFAKEFAAAYNQN